MRSLFEDEKWMSLALDEARLAAREGEIPVGAVIVRDGEMISLAHNACEKEKDATAHAECLAIREASKRVNSWRLSDVTLYVTMEPCPMCAGAAINARIPRIVFGTPDPRAGACGSLVNLPAYPLEERPECQGGVLEEECRALLRDFFSDVRKKRKNNA